MPSKLEITDPRDRRWKSLLGLRVCVSGSDVQQMLNEVDVIAADYVMKDLEETFRDIEEAFDIEEHDGELRFVGRTSSCESFISGNLEHIIQNAILPEPGYDFESREQVDRARIKLERLERMVAWCRQEFDRKSAARDTETGD